MGLPLPPFPAVCPDYIWNELLVNIGDGNPRVPSLQKMPADLLQNGKRLVFGFSPR